MGACVYQGWGTPDESLAESSDAGDKCMAREQLYVYPPLLGGWKEGA